MKFLNKKWLYMSLMVSAFGLYSCSETDEPQAPSFPEKSEQLTGNVGEIQFLKFNPNWSWHLSSDAVWCVLGEDSLQDISGEPGEQNIKVSITDAAWEFTATKANITLAMGGEEMVIATITRGAKNYELQVKNAEGAAVDSIIINEKGIATYTVVSNFTFAATQVPQWLTYMPYDIEGEVYSKTITLTINKGFEKNAADSVIVFTNADATKKFEVPVLYSGMNATDIDFTPSTTWGLHVSADGKTYYSALNTDVINDAPYNVTISAANDAYTLVYYKWDNQYGMTQIQTAWETPWFSAEDDSKGNVTVSFVENTGDERKGYLLAFPDSIYNTISSNLDGFICDQSSDVWQLHTQAEKYLVAEFIQEAGEVSAKPFDVMLQGYLPLEVTKVTDASVLEFVSGECMYSGEEVYQVSCDPGSFLQIFPNLGEDVWNCEIMPMVIGVTDAQQEEMGLEPGIWEDGRNYISLSTPGIDGPVYISFRDNMWQFHKVLIIYPN